MTTDNANEPIADEQPEPDETAIEEAAPEKLREIRRFSAEVIAKARILWATGIFRSDTELQTALGIKGSPVIRQWRKLKQPDGQDWYAFREQWGAIDGPRVEWMGADSEIEIRMRMMNQAGRVVATAMAALDQTHWFFENGDPATHLWTFDKSGNLMKTKLQGLGPTNFGQVTSALAAGSAVMEKQMDAMTRLQAMMGDREAEHIKIAQELGRRLADGGHKLTDEQRRILVTIEREVRDEEDVAPVHGALEERVNEEDEELDETDDYEDDLDDETTEEGE